MSIPNVKKKEGPLRGGDAARAKRGQALLQEGEQAPHDSGGDVKKIRREVSLEVLPQTLGLDNSLPLLNFEDWRVVSQADSKIG